MECREGPRAPGRRPRLEEVLNAFLRSSVMTLSSNCSHNASTVGDTDAKVQGRSTFEEAHDTGRKGTTPALQGLRDENARKNKRYRHDMTVNRPRISKSCGKHSSEVGQSELREEAKLSISPAADANCREERFRFLHA